MRSTITMEPQRNNLLLIIMTRPRQIMQRVMHKSIRELRQLLQLMLLTVFHTKVGLKTRTTQITSLLWMLNIQQRHSHIKKLQPKLSPFKWQSNLLQRKLKLKNQHMSNLSQTNIPQSNLLRQLLLTKKQNRQKDLAKSKSSMSHKRWSHRCHLTHKQNRMTLH